MKRISTPWRIKLRTRDLLYRIIVAMVLTTLLFVSPLNRPPFEIHIPWIGRSRGCTELAYRPLRVGISRWAGFAGGLLANGGPHPGRDAARRWEHKYGVDFVFLDDFASQQDALSGCADSGDHVDVLSTTIDSWAAQYPLLVRDKIHASAFVQVARSQDACALMAEPDLKDHIQYLPKLTLGTPKLTAAHAIALRVLAGHSEVIFPTQTAQDALDGFQRRRFNAVALCEPFLHRLLTGDPKVERIDQPAPEVFILVARDEVIEHSPEILTDFAQRWLRGNQDSRGNLPLVLDLLREQRESSGAPEDQTDDRTLESELEQAQMSTPEDNREMFGADYEKQFGTANQRWTDAKMTDPASPQDSRTLAIIKRIAPLADPSLCAESTNREKTSLKEAFPVPYEVFFDPGSSELSEIDEEWVSNISRILRVEPHAQLCITGHTDSTGPDTLNKTLSYDRANVVAEYLKVSSERIATFGKAASEPKAPNSTPEGRAQNRRAEIRVVWAVQNER